MESRSFRAPSYLTSTSRPRASSSSSTSSDGSSIAPAEGGLGAEASRMSSRKPGTEESRTSTSHLPHLDPVSINRSRPIAIELPSSAIAARKKSLPVYTPDEPLSARGDLPGGYFPLHEDPSTRSYKPHPFHHSPSETMPSPSSMSMSASRPEATPRGGFQPETLSIPMGKYHPSNYKITPVSSPGPTSNPPANLAMPASSSRKQSSSSSNHTKHHHRKGSDVRRKIQQYQRDMIAQARLASASTSGAASLMPKPISPRLLPLGSPDELSAAMTPLELGDASAGYLGARALAGESRESEMVGKMMRMEEERRRREGQSSPVARV